MVNSWHPTKKEIQQSNIYKMMRVVGSSSYEDFWKWSVENKTYFWAKTVEKLGIVFAKSYSSILDISEGVEKAKWLFGAQMNIVDSCFQNSPDATAVVFQRPGAPLQKVTQQQLESQVNRAANGLRDLGILEGEYIALMMPMTLEAVVLYLAAIKAGIPVATIADSFASKEVSVRLEIAKSRWLFTQDFIHRKGKTHALYQKNCLANVPKMVVVQTASSAHKLRDQDLYWADFLSGKSDFVSVKQSPQEAITLLFSSGTTGTPKAVPWDHTTPIKSASDAHYHHNIQRGDLLCWPTNLGWMMGPWLVFSALINQAAIALYSGAPSEKGFGGFVAEAGVTLLGVVPSMVQQWKQSGVMESFDWNALKCFSSTGEVSNPREMSYLMALAGYKPVIEYCGGTEIGGGYIASTLLQENRPGAFSSQTLGGEFVLLNPRGQLDKKGEVFLIPPIMGLSTRLHNQDHHAIYYRDTPRYKNQILRRHGDQFEKISQGHYRALGRTDDSMNLGGIKVAAVQIEAVVNRLSFVAEAAAVASSPDVGGACRLVIFYVAAEKISQKEALVDIQNALKTELNPLFKVEDLVKIDNLPRTASQKIMRRALRRQRRS